MVIALDKKQMQWHNVKTGKDETIPALHPHWKEDVNFIIYNHLPPGEYTGAVYEEWSERLGFIAEDLKWLLKLTHHMFWCQVIFDESLQSCLDSFLKFAPRHYDSRLPESAVRQLEKVSRLVFMVFVRLATHKESKESIITPSVFGDIIYENFLFDIPKLMDLCVLYGAGNHQFLSKIIHNIFTQQPKYEHDLADSVQTVLTVFDNIENKCNVNRSSGTLSPQKLSDVANFKSLTTMPHHELCDIIFYLADTAATLLSFLEIYPPACRVYHVSSFCVRIAGLYEGVIPLMKEAIKERSFPNESLQKQAGHHLNRAQTLLVKLFRHVLNTCCVQSILEHSVTAGDYIEDLLSVMSAILGERRFLAKYQSMFPFEDDRSIILQTDYTIDDARLQFIEDGILDAFSVYGKRKTKSTSPGSHSNPSHSSNSCLDSQVGTSKVEQIDYTDLEGACAPRVTGIELDSLVTSVKDLLPDLGDGFIELCLEESDYDVERVINMVLEDKFPPSLQSVDRSLPRVHPLTSNSPDLVTQRANIYDNDEFDVFSKTSVDTSRITKGKKEKTSLDTLEDKSSIAQLKPLYDVYGAVDALSIYDDRMYDDEYDDTYDTHEVGADDATADELRQRRPFTIPRVLRGAGQRFSDEDEDSEDDSEGSPDKQNDEKANTTQSNGTGKRSQVKGQHQGVTNQNSRPPQKYDVKGKPKGKGQEANVVKNRDYKEKNKSSRANHNRKNMADRKRMKGMIPS